MKNIYQGSSLIQSYVKVFIFYESISDMFCGEIESDSTVYLKKRIKHSNR